MGADGGCSPRLPSDGSRRGEPLHDRLGVGCPMLPRRPGARRRGSRARPERSVCRENDLVGGGRQRAAARQRPQRPRPDARSGPIGVWRARAGGRGAAARPDPPPASGAGETRRRRTGAALSAETPARRASGPKTRPPGPERTASGVGQPDQDPTPLALRPHRRRVGRPPAPVPAVGQRRRRGASRRGRFATPLDHRVRHHRGGERTGHEGATTNDTA